MRKFDKRKEKERLEKMSLLEENLRKKGYQNIAGVDEAGRGPLAGPVVAACCILPQGFYLEGINDCKLVKPEQRELIYQKLIHDQRIQVSLGVVDEKRIDQINILQASLEAMQIAVNKLPIQPDFLLVDGNKLPKITLPMQAVVKGDTLSISIAAASIIAKYTRDQIMQNHHVSYPDYGFDQHKGYGTKKHRDAIAKYGICPLHRLSFTTQRKKKLFSSF